MPAKLDLVIHPPTRLQLCAFLSPLMEAEFQILRDQLAVSDSVLSKHVKALEEAGYLGLRKSAVNGRQRTWVHLTGAGRKAFAAHLEALRRLADASTMVPGKPLAQ